MVKALITGAGGQDASYLMEFLLEKGYEVHGIIRRSSTHNTSRIDHLLDKITLFEGDITDYSFMAGICPNYDEIYNLAAQSHVGTSFATPIYTADVNYIGCLNVLEILANIKPYRDRVGNKTPKLYQASTSEIFGYNYSTQLNNPTKFQDENTPFAPNSPYAIAKLAAHNAVRVYREAYGLHASCGILFNHESCRRPENFVTKKITTYLDRLYRHDRNKGEYPILELGNLDAIRDWGYSKEYIEGMWLMLQQEKPDDYVLATGEAHSVKEFLIEAFSIYGLDWKRYVGLDASLRRPCEVPYLCGMATKAKEILGWEATTKFKDLIKIMIDGK